MKAPSLRRILKEAAAVVAVTLLGLAGFELLLRGIFLVRNSAVDAIPLPYVIGHDYGPQPPWVDGLRILVPDDELIWRNQAHVRRRYIDVFTPVERDEDRYGLIRQFIPRIPPSLRPNPVWEIALNAEGFRDEELPRTKPPGSFRIACIGDSWTFGANVGHDDAYPRRLAALVQAEYPGRRCDVLNLGVLGYTSFQGLRLLDQGVMDLEPDIVVAGYAMNDADVAGYRDKDVTGSPQPKDLRATLASAIAESEMVKLLKYFALLTTYEPKTIGDHLRAKAQAAPGAETAVDYAELEEWTRVSPADYETNMEALVDRAREGGARVILLFNELWPESPYRQVLGRVAAAKSVPLIDSSRLIADERRRREEEKERALGLAPLPAPRRAPGGEIEVIFRVDSGDYPVPAAIFIAGSHPALGDCEPNVVAMYDDGTHGDQRAGDHVWSLAASFAPGTRLAYVYTNSGARGVWEGLDVPHIRQLTVAAPDSAGRVYRSIETFGAIAMQADSWHPNAAGYDLIARAVLDTLRADPGFRAFTGAATGEGGRR